MPVDLLIDWRLAPDSMSASARHRTSELYMAAVSRRPLTKWLGSLGLGLFRGVVPRVGFEPTLNGF